VSYSISLPPNSTKLPMSSSIRVMKDKNVLERSPYQTTSAISSNARFGKSMFTASLAMSVPGHSRPMHSVPVPINVPLLLQQRHYCSTRRNDASGQSQTYRPSIEQLRSFPAPLTYRPGFRCRALALPARYESSYAIAARSGQMKN
jgi:hypothetical protein